MPGHRIKDVCAATLRVKIRRCAIKRILLIFVVTLFAAVSQLKTISSMLVGARTPVMNYRSMSTTTIPSRASSSQNKNIECHNQTALPRTKTPETQRRQTEQSHRQRHSETLSYTLWMQHAPCLDYLAQSPKNFKSMSRTELLCCLKSVRDAIPLGLTQQDRPTLEKAQFSESFIRALPARDLHDLEAVLLLPVRHHWGNTNLVEKLTHMMPFSASM